ncbi:type II toxin-antitoxin system HicB family antitoxin [Candidatus Micrarchaeota archaeon]|nr:type II toxin-antitoxin system HicB family antitoxin [Candidatus Micrarchaeota archaeon]
MQLLGFSVVVIHEGNSFSAWSPDLDVASQGDTVEGALANLKEALELHLECLTPEGTRGNQKEAGNAPYGHA